MYINCFHFALPALCVSFNVFKEPSSRYSFHKKLIYSNTELFEEQPYYRDDKTLRDTINRIIRQLRVTEICYKIDYKQSNWDWETMKKFGKYETNLNGLTKHYDQLIEDLLITELSGKDATIFASELRENRYHPPKEYYLKWINENYIIDNTTIVNFDQIVVTELVDFTSNLK